MMIIMFTGHEVDVVADIHVQNVAFVFHSFTKKDLKSNKIMEGELNYQRKIIHHYRFNNNK